MKARALAIGAGALFAAAVATYGLGGTTPLLLALGSSRLVRIPPTTVTRHELASVLGAALTFEVDPGLPTVAQVPLGAPLAPAARASLVAAAAANLRTLYAPRRYGLTATPNALAAWPHLRVLAGGVNRLKLSAVSVVGPTADAAWTGVLWSLLTTKGATGWSTPHRTANGVHGTASFVFEHGVWLLWGWSSGFTAGGGGP